MLKKEFGGYFEFDVLSGRKKDFHTNAIKLNTARNAINYLCITNNYKKLYIPYYLCDSVKNALCRDSIKYELYYLNEDFSPKINTNKIKSNEAILYPNYFGINSFQTTKAVEKFKRIIIDNTQAFFSKTIKTNAVYSARKFFAVPDGAYAYSTSKKRLVLDQDYSHTRMLGLLKRYEIDAKTGYLDSLHVEKSLSTQSIKLMSKLSNTLLKNINYKFCAEARLKNFNIFDKTLSSINELNTSLSTQDIPMVYPLLINNENLRRKLVESEIYIPQWWESVMMKVPPHTFEYYLSKYLIPLPIDHRYKGSDIKYIIKKIYKILSIKETI